MKQILFACVLALAAGCGGGKEKPPEMAPVSGTIKFNGKPLSDAKVVFSAAGYPPNEMEVTDGKFTGRAMIGANKVAVTAKKKASAAASRADRGRENDIAKGCNEQSGGPDPAARSKQFLADWAPGSNHLETVTAGDGNVYSFNIK